MDDIADQFSASSDENKFAEIMKELMNKDKIEMITDLTSDEIKLITRIYMIAKMKKIDIWFQGLAIFMELQLSKNRRSRNEMIEALRPLIVNPEKPFLGGLLGGNRRY